MKKKIVEKNKVLESAAELFRVREDIIGFFEKGIFQFKGNVFKTKEERSEEKSEEKIKKYINNTSVFTKEKSKDVNNDLFKTYFNFSEPIDLAKKLSETKDKMKNNDLVELIRVRWINLKDETEKMSKEEIKNKKPNEILGIVNKIIDFNKEIQKQQEGSRLKILTSDQMLNRLPISLPQLKAGNNSKKLKNEIIILFVQIKETYKITL